RKGTVATARGARALSVEAMNASAASVLASLRRLDRRLAAAAAMVPDVYGREAASRGFRGLYVGAADVVAVLQRDPGAPMFAIVPGDASSDESDIASSRLASLARACGL